MANQLCIVLDFGGQYNQLVARRVRECNVYCEIYSYKIDIEKIKELNPKGIILTGGPNSCYEEGSPSYQKELFKVHLPDAYIEHGSVDILKKEIVGLNVKNILQNQDHLFVRHVKNIYILIKYQDNVRVVKQCRYGHRISRSYMSP